MGILHEFVLFTSLLNHVFKNTRFFEVATFYRILFLNSPKANKLSSRLGKEYEPVNCFAAV